MNAHVNTKPGEVCESNRYLVIWREGRAAARAGLLRGMTKRRGFDLRVWCEGYDSVGNGVSDNVGQKVSDNVGQAEG